MAFEIAPLEQPTILPPNPDSDKDNHTTKRLDIAKRLYKERNITPEDAAAIVGVDVMELEKLFSDQESHAAETILVCGGAGFIGSNFVRYVLQKYPRDKVIVYDALTYAGNIDNLKSISTSDRYMFYKGNIVDKKRLKQVIQKHSVDYIINFAAESHVTRSLFLDAEEFVKTNVMGVHSLLEAVRFSSGIKRFLHISTDEVYGSLGLQEDRKFFEHDSFQPNVPYSATKAGGDLLVRAWHQSYGVPVIVTHCTNNYGPFQHPEKLIPNVVRRLMNGKKVQIHGQGHHIRDWIFVEDHCEALDILLRKGTNGEVYNIAGTNEKSTLEVVRLLLELMNQSEDAIEFVKDRPGNDLRYALHIKKMKEQFGWEPKVNFEQGIERTVQWYKNNIDWVERIWQDNQEFNKYII